LNLFKSIETAEKSGKRHFVGALHEWPLLAFTFILSALVALSVAGVGHQSAEWLKLVMVIAGFAGAMLSMMHLGKKTRMWRAVLNLKNSWLSREIFFFSLYFVAMITDFYFFNLHYYLVLIPGILTLFSIDMLYKPVQQKWRVPWHSGQTIFIALSLAFLFLLMPWYILGLWIFRVGLQLYFIVKNPLNLVKKSLIFVRWGLVDLAMIFYYFDLSMVWIIAIVMVSEFLDRILFYEDLELDSMSK
jgi:DMSO reductase anchor subunit